MNSPVVYKFSNTAPEKVPETSFSDWTYIESLYKNRGWQIDDLLHTGCLKLAGYQFDWRNCGLNKYVYKETSSGCLYEVWAPNKTLLRKAVYGRISYIVNVPKKSW